MPVNIEPGVEIIELKVEPNSPVFISSVEEFSTYMHKMKGAGIEDRKGLFYPKSYLIEHAYMGEDWGLENATKWHLLEQDSLTNLRLALETVFRANTMNEPKNLCLGVNHQTGYDCPMFEVSANGFLVDIVVENAYKKTIADVALFLYQQFMFCFFRQFQQTVDVNYALKREMVELQKLKKGVLGAVRDAGGKPLG